MIAKWKKQLNNVTWGYRDKFKEIINQLVKRGYISPENNRSLQIFDEIFTKLITDNYINDVILDEYLSALDKSMGWLLLWPELFEGWVNYSLHLMEREWYHARRFFRIWKDNNKNITEPSEVRFILDKLHLLENRSDINISLAFLEGYNEIRNEITKEGIQRFIEEGLAIANNNLESAELFFKLQLSTSRKAIERIKTDSQLDELKDRLHKLIQGICGKEFNIDNHSVLDSDELIMRGSNIICLCNGLYLPQRVSVYDSKEDNQSFYLGVSYLAAFSHLFNGFTTVHGYPGYESAQKVISGIYSNVNTENDILYNIFYLSDLIRILNRSVIEFPGIKKVLEKLIKHEYEFNPLNINSLMDKLLYRALYLEFVSEKLFISEKTIEKYYQYLKKTMTDCKDYKTVLQKLPELINSFINIFSKNKSKYNLSSLRMLTFYSDYGYTAEPSEASMEMGGLDKYDIDSSPDTDNQEEKIKAIESSVDGDKGNNEDEKEKKDNTLTGYLYDEWNHEVQDYLNNWCCLNEIRPKIRKKTSSLQLNFYHIEKVRKVFERLKPDLLRKEKNLADGDEIMVDPMINFMVEKKANLSPEERVYSKQFKQERDIATSLLIDISGSTSEEVDENSVLEIEKKSSALLAEGLNILGDKFGIYGFSGSGRKKCRFFIFKDFSEEWGEDQKLRLSGAKPDNSTRIGVAIRHTITRMNKIGSSKKIIMVITDGKPQDSEYSPKNLYAQYDVRKACQEAMNQGIIVFGISTENNSLEDLEIMFPDKRYLVIKDISHLPALLSKYYTRLTY